MIEWQRGQNIFYKSFKSQRQNIIQYKHLQITIVICQNLQDFSYFAKKKKKKKKENRHGNAASEIKRGRWSMTAWKLQLHNLQDTHPNEKAPWNRFFTSYALQLQFKKKHEITGCINTARSQSWNLSRRPYVDDEC